MDDAKWLSWAKRLINISEIGIHYSKNEMERKRYIDVRRIAMEMINNNSNNNFEDIVLDPIDRYPTPQVIIRAIVLCDKQILLVKERKNGKWNLPGGYADIDESPSEAVHREVLEETSLDVKVKKIMAIYESKRKKIYNQYSIFFLCDVDKVDLYRFPENNPEIQEVAFWDIDGVSRLELNDYFIDHWERIKNIILNSQKGISEFD